MIKPFYTAVEPPFDVVIHDGEGAYFARLISTQENIARDISRAQVIAIALNRQSADFIAGIK